MNYLSGSAIILTLGPVIQQRKRLNKCLCLKKYVCMLSQTPVLI